MTMIFQISKQITRLPRWTSNYSREEWTKYHWESQNVNIPPFLYYIVEDSMENVKTQLLGLTATSNVQ
jgi:hypothetical protein